jgi:hypothetical protein
MCSLSYVKSRGKIGHESKRGTIKDVGREKGRIRKGNWRGEYNQNTSYAWMEMS